MLRADAEIALTASAVVQEYGHVEAAVLDKAVYETRPVVSALPVRDGGAVDLDLDGTEPDNWVQAVLNEVASTYGAILDELDDEPSGSALNVETDWTEWREMMAQYAPLRAEITRKLLS